MNKPKNHRVIKVRFLPPTNNQSARIRFTEFRGSHTKGKVIPYATGRHNPGDTLQQALHYLQSIGINAVGYGEDENYYYIFSDSWGSNFTEITGEKVEQA